MRLHTAFRTRVLELCDLQNITLYELAARAELPRTTLASAMDPAKGNPSLRTVEKIAAGFRLTAKEFFDSELFDEYL